MTLFLSSSGRLSGGRFWVAVLVVYGLGFASQMLTAPVMLERVSLSAFAAAQFVLLWAWYALHAKRLRDAGRSTGLALGVAVIYLLALVLLLIVLAAFMMPGQSGLMMPGEKAPDAVPASGILWIYVLALWFATSGGFFPQPDQTSAIVLSSMLFVIAAAPVLLVLGCTLWAGTRRSEPPKGGPA
jgi:uncharacterized membrane protein YhaH (DUF805 family)